MKSNQSIQKSPVLPFVEMRQALNSNACYHTHSHDEFSFGVIDAGTADYRNRQYVDSIHQGVFVTINPGDAHSCNPHKGLWSYRMLFVDAQWVGHWQAEDTSHSMDFEAFSTRFVENAALYKQFSGLYESLKTSSELLNSESQLIGLMHGLVPDRRRTIATQALDRTGVLRAKELLLDQDDRNVSLAEVAKESGLSRFHLVRSFKRQFGQTPHAFLLDHRIKKAKLALQQGTSLADVALNLGFADQAHFQRHFKKRMAVTPGQYQNFFL